MASNVINRWFINYKPSEAITLAINVFSTHQRSSLHIMALLSSRLWEFHTQKNRIISMRTKQWAFNKKGHNFQITRNFHYPHI